MLVDNVNPSLDLAAADLSAALSVYLETHQVTQRLGAWLDLPDIDCVPVRLTTTRHGAFRLHSVVPARKGGLSACYVKENHHAR